MTAATFTANPCVGRSARCLPEPDGRARALAVLVCDARVGMVPRGADSPGMGIGLRVMTRISEQFTIASGPAAAGRLTPSTG